jgi:hypothetical protein
MGSEQAETMDVNNLHIIEEVKTKIKLEFAQSIRQLQILYDLQCADFEEQKEMTLVR